MTEFRREDVLKGISKLIQSVGLTSANVIQYFKTGGKGEKQELEKPIDAIVDEICNEKLRSEKWHGQNQ